MRILFQLTLATVILATSATICDDKKVDDGFVQLFNGKDLKGWKTHPDDKAKWEVKDGNLLGSGTPGHLFSERGDYANFIFRVEAKINDGGNSGQFFRTKFAKAFPAGYEAQINANHSDKIRTGSLYPSFNRNLTKEQQAKFLVLEAPHKADEWFTQEVVADGNQIVIKVNGKVVVEYIDTANTFKSGHFAIQQHDPKSRVTIRKIEVKELPNR